MEEAFRLFKSTREYLTPVLTESAFLEKGMLTPEEFVRAGDHLVRSSPSWSWEAGEEKSRRPYLPPNKQYLVTRGVPSLQRVNALQASYFYKETNEVENGLGNEAWCSAEFGNSGSEEADNDIDFVEKDFENLGKEAASEVTSSGKPPGEPSKAVDEYLDMEDGSLDLDAATLKMETTKDGVATVKVRRYDVSITYDNYYRTPRVWMYGYNEDGSPLAPEAIFEV